MNQLTQPLLARQVDGEVIEMTPIAPNLQEPQANRANYAPVPDHQPPPRQDSQSAQDSLKCAGCSKDLLYARGAYAVKCPICSTVTGAVPISKVRCSKCSRDLLCPAFALYVSCPCGKVLGNQFIGGRPR